MAAEFRHLIEIELLDDLQSKQVAVQNSHFCVQIGRVVVIHARVARVAQILQHWIGFVDGDASNRVIDRSYAQCCDQRGAEDRGQGAHDYPFPLNQDPQILAQDRVLSGHCRMNGGDVAADLHGCGPHLTHLIPDLHYRRWLHLPPQLDRKLK